MNTSKNLNLAKRLRQARKAASEQSAKLSSQQVMDQMFKNGSDRKQNPFLTGEWKLIGSPTQQQYLKSSQSPNS